MPGTPAITNALGSANLASLRFDPAARAAHYEVTVLDAAGTATVATLYTCKPSTSLPSGCLAVSPVPSSTQGTFAIPLARLPSTGKFRFRMRTLDANATPGAWSAVQPALASAPVTVGAPSAVGPVQVASSSATGATIEFPPTWLAESYEVEVLDANGAVVGTVVIPAADLQTCAAAPPPV